MAEINRTKLPMISEIDVWVQVACPRLSIDWGEGFDKPILTPYELEVAMNETQWQTVYPMDYYSNDGGSWSNMAHR
jgi:2-(3-amino-3-carboxypropyl)histidine synthase